MWGYASAVASDRLAHRMGREGLVASLAVLHAGASCIDAQHDEEQDGEAPQ